MNTKLITILSLISGPAFAYNLIKGELTVYNSSPNTISCNYTGSAKQKISPRNSAKFVAANQDASLTFMCEELNGNRNFEEIQITPDSVVDASLIKCSSRNNNELWMEILENTDNQHQFLGVNDRKYCETYNYTDYWYDIGLTWRTN